MPFQPSVMTMLFLGRVYMRLDQHLAQQIDQQSALQTSQKEKNERLSFMLLFHPHNLTAKHIIVSKTPHYFKELKKLKKNDNRTGRIFSQPSFDFIQVRQKHREVSS